MGPDGAIYVCNNGGRFTEMEMEGLCFPGPVTPEKYIGGRIQRVDIATGEVTDLYTEFDGNPLWAPNDLVFDAHGGFYFTDHGLSHERDAHLTGIYYGKADGSSVKEIVFPAHEPNGIGLSPDGTSSTGPRPGRAGSCSATSLGPGELAEASIVDTSVCLYGFPGFQLLDSLAVDADGNVCVATLVNGGVTVGVAQGRAASTSSRPTTCSRPTCASAATT